MYYTHLWHRDEKTDHLDDDTQQVREDFGEFWKTPQFLEYPKVPITEFNCLSTIQDRFPSIILNVSKISAKTALSLRENSIEYILNSLEVTNVGNNYQVLGICTNRSIEINDLHYLGCSYSYTDRYGNIYSIHGLLQ